MAPRKLTPIQRRLAKQKAQEQSKAATTAPKTYTLSAEDYKAIPLLRDPAKEQKLVRHVLDRMMLANTVRNQRTDRQRDIDIQISGFIKQEGEDKKRERDNRRGKAPKPVKHNLPLTGAQLDEEVTYLMSVFAPEMDIFEATSSANKSHIAQGLTAEVNRQGQTAQYYRQLAKFCVNAVRYNFSAMTCLWEERQGIKFEASNAQISKKKDVVWKGNALISCDAYNFFYDPTVHPVDVPTKGEYFATVELLTAFAAKKMGAEKKLVGVDRFVSSAGVVMNNGQTSFYQFPPDVRSHSEGTRSGTNWLSFMNDGAAASAQTSVPSIEAIRYTTWIIPSEFGLSESKEHEIWRLTIVNGMFLAYAEQIEDSHGMLPVVCAAPLEDDLINSQRTYAEQLIPLQHFASFLMNTHQDATRKAIYGITVFDQNLFPGVDLGTEDLIGARIRMRSSSTGVDIDKAFRHYNAAPGTEDHVNQIESIDRLMQKILPTNSQQQVADLERATLYQAAATVQGANRRNLKIARMISDQALGLLKLIMIYNIYAKSLVITYSDPKTGVETTINPADLVDANLEFDVGTGLKGIDRLMQLQIMQAVLNSVLQSAQANQQIDVVKLLDFVATLAGLRFDLTQFRLPAPPAGTEPNAGAAAPASPGGKSAPAPQPTPEQLAAIENASAGQGPNAQAL